MPLGLLPMAMATTWSSVLCSHISFVRLKTILLQLVPMPYQLMCRHVEVKKTSLNEKTGGLRGF
jgi:hypothetical protein